MDSVREKVESMVSITLGTCFHVGFLTFSSRTPLIVLLNVTTPTPTQQGKLSSSGQGQTK